MSSLFIKVKIHCKKATTYYFFSDYNKMDADQGAFVRSKLKKLQNIFNFKGNLNFTYAESSVMMERTLHILFVKKGSQE